MTDAEKREVFERLLLNLMDEALGPAMQVQVRQRILEIRGDGERLRSFQMALRKILPSLHVSLEPFRPVESAYIHIPAWAYDNVKDIVEGVNGRTSGNIFGDDKPFSFDNDDEPPDFGSSWRPPQP